MHAEQLPLHEAGWRPVASPLAGGAVELKSRTLRVADMRSNHELGWMIGEMIQRNHEAYPLCREKTSVDAHRAYASWAQAADTAEAGLPQCR